MTTVPAFGGFYLHKQGTKRRVHADAEAARTEAQRLADANQETFVITREIACVVPATEAAELKDAGA